ncbi:MAG: hypothetical protein ACPG8F_00755 [Flavobacteriaceae bacterium]
MPMLCGFAITSRLGDPMLLLTRKDQQKLTDWLRNELGEAPFVFNTNKGLYLFLEKESCSAYLVTRLNHFLTQYISHPYLLYNCSNEPHFFYKELTQVLQDKGMSTYAWKNFISSFLFQLQPFVGNSKSVFSLFKSFVAVIKLSGNEAQLSYLKRKMNLLRERVNITSLVFG